MSYDLRIYKYYPYYQKYLELIKDNNVLFLCDLIGGTPYKVAAKLSVTNPNIQVVTGANVGALIDSGMKMDKMSIQELAEYAKTRTLIHSTIFKMVKEEINNSDGI